MNENLLRRIKNQLNAKFYIMNDAWLQDCVKYFVRDKTPREMTDKHILEFVEGQWQLSDLREINNEKGCLPRNLIQQVHTVLTGTYILQVNKMYDIANSKYKQLCEIRKINSENLVVAEEERQAEWEPKARRMIQLCLTDGVQDIVAIEYKPLKQMTNMLLPGYKVMITGPVDCRRGIILLEDGKYKEIGGEVECLLQSNALENVLARALEEPENPDPYNDNGLSRAVNQNVQNDNINSNDSLLFDDDFEEIVDLEAVTAIEQRNQEAETIQNSIGNMCNQKQNREMNETTENFLEDIDFEPLENWPNDSPMRSIHPASRVEIEKFDEEDDIMIIEASTSAHNSRSKELPSTSSFRNKYASEFPDNDFDFDDCEIICTEKSRSQQDENLSKTKEYSLPLMPKSKLTTHDTVKKVKTNISTVALTNQNEKSVASVSSTVEQTANKETINVLSDILSEPIIGRARRIVRAKVKNHSLSALEKQGKHWAVTAVIADHTSSIRVCFDSEILEKYIGFSVQEFSQKKKLAKLDSQVNNELRLNLRKAQHQIENLDALLELELTKDKIPKIVNIM